AVDVRLELERERALEGDELEVVVSVEAANGADRLELLIDVPRGLEVADGDNPTAFHLRDGETRDVRLELRCARWGGYRVGRVLLRARDRFDLVTWEWAVDVRLPLKVYPREEFLRELLRPAETQVFSG